MSPKPEVSQNVEVTPQLALDARQIGAPVVVEMFDIPRTSPKILAQLAEMGSKEY